MERGSDGKAEKRCAIKLSGKTLFLFCSAKQKREREARFTSMKWIGKGSGQEKSLSASGVTGHIYVISSSNPLT